ncbi:carbohydrate-binding domain-containing protein [Nonomuraea basaltis]|uniref:carbohydrate-binding domain-containing protein n=1 Tax=Nonomuraea basaltis TaxID=2495887 RepID=UPI00110C6DE6|nr:carbohydrate-binding domain-containing protein [Nonomuraea basaltis]TMR98318.1 carbohydrate-binding domain-containing protein [Nonomuraea basaltis]
MKIRKRVTAALASVVLTGTLLAGCSTETTGTSAAASVSASSAVAGVNGAQDAAAVLAANQADHAADGDATWEESKVVDIKLAGGTATATGDGVTIDGSTVTITAGGTYRLTGTLTDGQVVVNAPDATVRLILAGADISSSSSAAIAATEADKVIVILADGSQNTLTDAGSYADDADVNAALYSAGDLTITGDGALTVHGRGNDAIAGQDGLVIASGTVTVDAADDGIRGKNYLVVEGGTVTVTQAGGDGLKADNTEEADAGYISITDGTVAVTAKGDGLDAATDLLVTGGKLTVSSGGGSGVAPADETSAKGLKSAVITVLEGGTIAVDSSDDAVHSDAAVHLNGASTTVASGDDGVHAEGALVIDDGTLKITSSVEGLEGAAIAVNGGQVSIVSSDDGVNAAGGTTDGAAAGRGGGEEVGDYSAVVTGGTLVINADGDGFDSNGTAAISGGTVVVNGPTQNGNGALDVNGDFTISGGVLVAAGSAGMAVAPGTDSAQGWLSATFDSAVAEGTTLHVVDSDGKVLGTFVTSKSIQSLVFSSAGIKSGTEYKIYAGGTSSGTSTGGLAASGDLGSAALTATVTAGEAPAGGFGGGPGRR